MSTSLWWTLRWLTLPLALSYEEDFFQKIPVDCRRGACSLVSVKRLRSWKLFCSRQSYLGRWVHVEKLSFWCVIRRNNNETAIKRSYFSPGACFSKTLFKMLKPQNPWLIFVNWSNERFERNNIKARDYLLKYRQVNPSSQKSSSFFWLWAKLERVWTWQTN